MARCRPRRCSRSSALIQLPRRSPSMNAPWRAMVTGTCGGDLTVTSPDAAITVDDHGKLAVVPSVDSATVDIDASTAALATAILTGKDDAELVISHTAPQISDAMAAAAVAHGEDLLTPGIPSPGLPAATYLAGGQTDTILIEAPSLSFKLWKDLDGFVDPCDIEAGRMDLEPGMDAFLAYLNGDPRFTVTSQEEFEIDGHRAVEVQYKIGELVTPPCWDFDGNEADKTGVLTWIPRAASGGFWNGRINDQGMVVVTEFDGAALIFEPVKPSGSTWVIDRDVLETVRFLDALPTPPAS